MSYGSGASSCFADAVAAGDGAKLEMATDVVARTRTAKEYTGCRRLVASDLVYALDMTAVGEPEQSYTWARLKRA
jgi:hypothetical protein